MRRLLGPVSRLRFMGRDSSRAFATMKVSQRRLEEFLEAEVAYLSQGGYSTITVEQILRHREPARIARLIQKELPARFATRLRQIQATTPEWRELPGMLPLHEMMYTSFRNLRTVDLKSSESLDEFTEVIRDLRKRHKPVVQIIAQAAQALRERGLMDGPELNEWMGKFMNSRAGTEMLTHHYMELLTCANADHIGIVDTCCDPAAVCQAAVEKVSNVLGFAGVPIELVEYHRVDDLQFSFISKYLSAIVEELLKNSVVATLGKKSSEPIRVTVSSEPRRVGIKISDKGGGVPFENSERIWEYSFTTTPENLQTCFLEESVLSGPGMGLPLSMLYANYMGGSFHLMSMPGIGTDTFLYLNRIDAGDSLLPGSSVQSDEVP